MITEALGIKGWGAISDRIILTSILTGDPLLIINRFGQAKTAIVDRLGQVLVHQLHKHYPEKELAVAIINAATASPEDWAGYLIPPQDITKSQKMILMKSPKSLIPCVMIGIDELGRISPRNQNNVLTLIQERRVDGHQTMCEILFAMMNPVMESNTDDGSEPLIAPLADRFALIIEPTEFSDMSVNDKREVINKAYRPNSKKNIFITSKDMLLGKDSYIVPESTSNSIWEFLGEAKKLYLQYCFDPISDDILKSTMEYVTILSTELPKNDSTNGFELYMSGRRAGFLMRSILANYAVGTVLKREDLVGSAEMALTHSFPNKAMGQNFNPQRLLTAHVTARKVLKSGESVMSNIMAEPNKWKRLQMAHHSELSPDEYTRIYKDVWKLYPDNSQIDVIMGLAMANNLVKKMSKHELADIGRKIVEVCNVPVKRFVLKTDNPEALQIGLKIQGDKHHATVRMVSLAQYVADKRGESFVNAWYFVEKIYTNATVVMNNQEGYDYEN